MVASVTFVERTCSKPVFAEEMLLFLDFYFYFRDFSGGRPKQNSTAGGSAELVVNFDSVETKEMAAILFMNVTLKLSEEEMPRLICWKCVCDFNNNNNNNDEAL